MTTIIEDAGTTLPSSPSNGQLFFQVGTGPKIYFGGSWYSLDQTAVEFLTILANNQSSTVSNSSLSAITSAISSQPTLDLTPLITALNSNSTNLVASTTNIASFVKALAIITEYWRQIGEVNLERVSNGASSLVINEPLVPDHPIVAAHNAAQTTIQS